MRNRSVLMSAVLVLAVLMSACNSAEPPMAPNAQEVGSDMAPPAGPTTNGTWRRTGYSVTGTVALTTANGTAQLSFSSDFSIAQTPGPVVYLNTTNNPNTGQPLRIGALRSRTGAQTYTFQIPPGVRYTWVIVWCDPFNVAMAEAPIAPTP
ncbi:DM13 domain-containing protein [Gemmatimonas sp.]|uniref:DM13 domain-containing protein n=1 Tax=Gemmatimonas sp. TaxID=1962908 RepID=UPI003983C0B6